MRLAISNIAWPSGADGPITPVLIECGIEGVEVAPSKVWPRPLDATAAEVAAYRASWERRGLEVVALQALLFGRDDLTIFADPTARARTRDYLRGMIALASALGAGVLVFGSPKNRRVGRLPSADAEAIAVPFFRELGDAAARHRVSFCIEPNPPDYGCDFVTSAEQGLALVERVGSEGFGLHLDAGGMTLAGDDVARVCARSLGVWKHLHISEPHLVPIGAGGVDHRAIAAAARRAGYGGWASIEMREPPADGPPGHALRDALGVARSAYLAAPADEAA